VNTDKKSRGAKGTFYASAGADSASSHRITANFVDFSRPALITLKITEPISAQSITPTAIKMNQTRTIIPISGA
jgi:hypothetical protein